ncbi:hypothetical protein BDY19DRAFT_397589 [Irpex rosettiformis]|uniref:Uncharacterized protein n=1 Tax=Irpex rosettiformis TaxID=378272 RepID=A0ACB8UF27_9APHY|nr:hypothetical protein BDY19DRAFT_397589 [Irpex rosettiformis]
MVWLSTTRSILLSQLQHICSAPTQLTSSRFVAIRTLLARNKLAHVRNLGDMISTQTDGCAVTDTATDQRSTALGASIISSTLSRSLLLNVCHRQSLLESGAVRSATVTQQSRDKPYTSPNDLSGQQVRCVLH